MRNVMNIAVINKSTTVSDDEAEEYTRVCGLQLSHHVAPAWSRYAPKVKFAKDESRLSTKWFRGYLLDDPDVSGALGYHDVDPHGYPYFRVFTKLSAQYGGVAPTLSHEMIEEFINPDCMGFRLDPQTNILYCEEGGDPVESDSYKLGGIDVSNFILPAWFDRNHQTDARFDYLGKLSAPFTMTRGGYLIYVQGGSEQSRNARRVVLDVGPDVPEELKPAKWHPAARTVKALNAAKRITGGN